MSEKKEEVKSLPFIKGDNIDLVASNSDWANLLCKWYNDPRVRQYSQNITPLTLEEIKKRFEPPKKWAIPEYIVFIIFHKKDNKPIGSIGFERINWVSRNANLFAAIGEPEYWGKGIIVEAAKLAINYGFTELNFHKIFVGVYDPNKRALRVIEKLGFEKEVVLKEQNYVEGKYVDNHEFSLSKKDWLNKREVEEN